MQYEHVAQFASAGPGARRAPAPARPLTVLLVSDDFNERLVLSAILKQEGLHVLEATHAGHAVLTCRDYDGPIQVLVADMDMSDVEACELVRRLQRLRPEMRALFVGEPAGDPDVYPPRHAAARPVLDKPCTPAELVAVIRRLQPAWITDRGRSGRGAAAERE